MFKTQYLNIYYPSPFQGYWYPENKKIEILSENKGVEGRRNIWKKRELNRVKKGEKWRHFENKWKKERKKESKEERIIKCKDR